MKKQHICSIGVNHDTGALYYFHDQLQMFNENNLKCVSEERLDRIKTSRSFPKKSISYSCENKNIDVVLVASKFTPTFALRIFNDLTKNQLHENTFNYILNLYVWYQSFLTSSKIIKNIERFFLTKYYKIKLKNNNIIFIDHHKCHAASTYYTSAFNEALCVTMDMMGDGLSITVSIGKGNQLKRIFSQTGNNGIGVFYTKITKILGFKPIRHEGKITGLAAHGEIDNAILKILKKIFYFENPGFNEVNYVYDLKKTHGLYKKLKSFSSIDIAATSQYYFEREILKFIKFWTSKTGIRKICVAGGIFANVKLNQKIKEISEKFYVFPHMGDGGLHFGALMYYIKPKPKRINNVFWGPEYSDEQILQTIKKFKINFTKPKNIHKEIALLLAKNKTVVRFDGKMEFGPRALGNRSILCQCNDRSVNDWLNKKLNRTEFMPFAPAVLSEYAKKCFHGINQDSYLAEFMTVTYKCKKYFIENCPGAVHIDNTARPQIVTKNSNLGLHKILSYYHKNTSLPAIINTSFNMHGEPIVCTPAQAINSFYKGKLDYLAIGKFLIKNDKNN